MENKTENIDDEYSKMIDYYSILDQVQLYSVIIMISIGITGNITSLFIFTRSSLNCKTNTGLLCALLCFLNLIAILYQVAAKRLDKFCEFLFYLPFNGEYFIETILLQLMSWTQVIISFDRFVAVIYPIKAMRLMSKKPVLYSIISAVFILILGVNSPYFIRTSESIMYMSDNQTRVMIEMSPEIIILTENVNVFMRVFIPYLIMLALDIKVVMRLRKFKGVLFGERRSKADRFTRNTILIDFIYLIFNLPSTVFNSYYLVVYFIMNGNFLRSPLVDVIVQSFTLLPYIYASILFLLFIAFNKIFRSEFKLMLRNKWFMAIKNRIC